MASKKRVRAQTGGQTISKEKREQMNAKGKPTKPLGLLDTSGSAGTGAVDIAKALISLSPAQRAKIKKMLLPSGETMLTAPGIAGKVQQFSPTDWSTSFDPASVAAAKTMFPDLFPAPVTTTTTAPVEPKPKFAKGGKVGKVMHEFKAGSLHSGSKKGPKVRSRDQAIAIALSEARQAGEDVPRRRAAVGGTAMFNAARGTAAGKSFAAKPGTTPLVPLQQQRVGDIQANTTGITNLTSDLRDFQPGGGADITALRDFQPLTGLGATTQNQLLSTGFQTDVAPLTEAAKIRAGQEFDTATSGINERLASLGLISSSAQTAAEARERAKMGERIGATGLEAGVNAAEAAAGRRVGGIGNELAVSGQRLGATEGALQGSLTQSGQRLSSLGTALGGETSAAGLNLEAAQGRAGAGQSLINSQMPQFGNEMAQPPAGGGLPAPQKRNVLGPTAGYTTAATGGRADLGDFLSNLLYGKQFTRRQAGPAPSSMQASRGAPIRDPYEGLNKQILREQLHRLQRPSGDRQPRGIGPEELGRAAASTLDPGNRLGRVAGDFGKLGQFMQFLGPQEVGANVRTAGHGFAEMGKTASSNAPSLAALESQNLANRIRTQGRQFGAGGGVPQPKLPQELGIQELSSYDPRRRFYNIGGPVESFNRLRSYDEGGGVAPGQDTGEDKIPAMLRSEELVLTPELAAAVEQANPLEPNPELIMSLQDLAKQPLEYDEGMGEHMAADGGAAPSFWDRLLHGSPEASAQTFETRFGYPPPTPPGREDVVRAIQAAVGALPDAAPPDFMEGIPSRAPQGPRDAFADLEGAPDLAPQGPSGFEELAPPKPGGVSIAGSISRPGDAGMGTITPRPGGKGSFSAMETTVPSAQPLSAEELTQQRLNDATRRRDLLSSALNTDVVGSPEKQARLLTALDNADRQVSTITSEVLAREQQRMQREETGVRRVMAQANLNESVASTLRSKAQQQTAEAALARQLLDAATSNPRVAQILNGIEKLGGIKDARTAAMYEAVFSKLLESEGVVLKENGRLKQLLFGAPRYEVQPSQEMAGEAPQDDTTAMLAAGQVPITPEMLQYYTQFAGVQ